MSLTLLNEKIKRHSKQNKPKILGFISIIISLGLVYAGGLTMFNLKQIDIVKEQRVENAQKAYWSFINGILSENLDKANIQAGFLRDNIQQQILSDYANNMNQLKKDIDNPTNESKLSKILSENLDDVYLNNKSDNDDLFVISLHNPSGIIYDKSINRSKNGQVGTWVVERSIHFNKILFDDAINKIIKQSNEKPIFWEFLVPKNPNHINIKYADNQELEKVFNTEGVEGLKTYEFLNPQYINANKTDIFGETDVSNTGQLTNNYKLVIVQGFNLYDELMNKHKDKIESYKNTIVTIENQAIDEKLNLQLEAFSVSIILLIIIIAIIAIQNTILEEEQKRDEVTNEEINELE